MRHRIFFAKGPAAGNQVESKGLNLSLAWFGLACLAGMHRPWWISATGANPIGSGLAPAQVKASLGTAGLTGRDWHIFRSMTMV
jgi:hypothetical protein